MGYIPTFEGWWPAARRFLRERTLPPRALWALGPERAGGGGRVSGSARRGAREEWPCGCWALHGAPQAGDRLGEELGWPVGEEQVLRSEGMPSPQPAGQPRAGRTRSRTRHQHAARPMRFFGMGYIPTFEGWWPAARGPGFCENVRSPLAPYGRLVRSVLEEAAAVAKRFRVPRERGAREEWLVRMLGAAALARLQAGGFMRARAPRASRRCAARYRRGPTETLLHPRAAMRPCRR